MPRADESRQRAWADIAAPLIGAAAVGGALAGCHPTGTRVLDPLETAAFASMFTMLAHYRAGPRAGLIVGVTTVLLARGWLLVPAVAALLLALTSVVPTRAPRWVAPLTAVLGVQVVLRWPSTLFHGFLHNRCGRPCCHLRRACVAPGLAPPTPMDREAAGRSARVGRDPRRSLRDRIALHAEPRCFRGAGEARTALSDVGTSDTNSVVAELGRAASDTHHAAGVMGSAVGMTTGARAVPVLAQQERFLDGDASGRLDCGGHRSS